MHDDERLDDRPRGRRLLLAGGLFLLAPLIGEFLFGNQAITDLSGIVLLAPLYGGGALLIREVTRRSGRGWPTIVLLAVAYGLFEVGPVDQMLWNPNYGGFPMGLVFAETHLAWLGTSVQLLQEVVSLHTVWSICVPIALIEAFDRGRQKPWLGRVGLTAVSVVFVTGSAFLAFAQIESDDFVATVGQFAGANVAIVVLVVAAFVVGRRPWSRVDAAAPSPWVVGAVALGSSSLYWAREHVAVSAWAIVVAWFVVVVTVVTFVLRWSRSRGWGASHRVALAGGFLLTYVWVGFQQATYLDVPRSTALLGNAVFGLGALILLFAAMRAVSTAPAERL
jgi:hypothetical protein